MQKSIPSSALRCIVASLVVIMLSACVTTQRGGFDKSASEDDAVAARVTAAKQYLQKRDFESARRHLKIALDIAPRSADVHDALALTFHASGELDLAAVHYRKAVDYSDGGSRFRVNFANFLYQQGKFEPAEAQLLAVVGDSLYEKRESALYLLGLTQQQLLQLAEAKQSFERALVLNPANRRVLRELAIMNYDAKDFEQAWRFFQQYRKYTSKPSAEMLLLGIELARELNQPDAEASYVIALKNIYPDSREYQSYLRDLENRQR
ncbi:MAG: type IV pilus biogenesis/stability protein PilW [Gammaproteobacteria bacterium]|nr:type IV pilus biogenesis/stability protein PilW [Gammaproteobacteria bacterium]